MPARLRSRFKDASTVLGTPRALILSFRWLFQRDYDVFCLDLNRFEAEPVQNPGVSWSDLCPSRMTDLLKTNSQLEAAELEGRLKKGHRCLLGWVDGSIAHYRWDFDGVASLWFLGLECAALPGDIVVLDVYTRPEARGGGIYTASAVNAALKAKQQGYKRYITFVATWNRPPQHVWREVLRSDHVGLIRYRPVFSSKRHCLHGDITMDSKGRICVMPSEQGA